MASLENLPTELVQNVASRLNDRELLCLRKTCRDLEAKTQHLFAGGFVRDVSYLIDRDYGITPKWTQKLARLPSISALRVIAFYFKFCDWKHLLRTVHAQIPAMTNLKKLR